MKGNGCPICEKKSKSRSKLTVEQYKLFASEIHDNKYDYSLVNDLIPEKISVICLIHGIFQVRPSAHVAPKQQYGCQRCANIESKGEIRIKRRLDELGIRYIREFSLATQTGINNNTLLRYDFYLPDYKVIVEYDGMHHFRPVRYGGQCYVDARRQHQRTKLYDGMKTMNAVLSGLYIIRIGFQSFDKIADILSDIPSIEIDPKNMVKNMEIFYDI